MISPCRIFLSDKSLLSANHKEVMRYLGMKSLDGEMKALYDECLNEVEKIANPKAVFVISDVSVIENCVRLDFADLESKSLSQNLKDCSQAYVFCATLGIEVDRAFQRYLCVSKAKAMMFSAIASSYIESYCDYLNSELVKDKTARPRFSPGYGDLKLECQERILQVLEANKNLGVTLTQSCMMTPVKTVTAIIGVK